MLYVMTYCSIVRQFHERNPKMNEIAPMPPPANDAGPVIRYPNEPPELRYARQSRNATVFIAWCVGVFIVLTLIGIIISTIQADNINNQLNQMYNGDISNCLSQGGSDPNC